MAAAKMLGQLDPSLIGRAESLFDGTFDGTMSQTQIKSALKVADALNNENVASGTRAITTWQRQHPKLAARGVQANEIFPASMATGSTNAPTASKFWKP